MGKTAVMMVQTIAELAQSYIAQAHSSGRSRPSRSRIVFFAPPRTTISLREPPSAVISIPCHENYALDCRPSRAFKRTWFRDRLVFYATDAEFDQCDRSLPRSTHTSSPPAEAFSSGSSAEPRPLLFLIFLRLGPQDR